MGVASLGDLFGVASAVSRRDLDTSLVCGVAWLVDFGVFGW